MPVAAKVGDFFQCFQWDPNNKSNGMELLFVCWQKSGGGNIWLIHPLHNSHPVCRTIPVIGRKCWWSTGDLHQFHFLGGWPSPHPPYPPFAPSLVLGIRSTGKLITLPCSLSPSKSSLSLVIEKLHHIKLTFWITGWVGALYIFWQNNFMIYLVKTDLEQ